MNWKSFTASASAALLTLATTSFLAGCSPTTSTLTVETEGAIAAGVCQAWKPVTYSSRDTEQTQLEARANNAARASYCDEAGGR